MQVAKLFSTKRQAIDKAKSTVFGAMVASAILVAFSITALNFLWNLRGYNARVIVAKEDARDTLEQNVANTEELKERFSTFEAGEVTSKEVLDALPSKYDFAALLTSVDSLAKRSGVLLSSLNGDDLTAEAVQTVIKPEPVAIEFSITAEGSYDDIQEFLETLNRSIRPFYIDTMEISGSDDNIQADIVMGTYYQPEASIDVETKVVE